MYSQLDCLNRCKVTLVAFVRFLASVNFQMYPQSSGPIRGKATLVAFVRFISRVSFWMLPQHTCLNICFFTLVAFIWFFSRMNLQMPFQIAWPNSCKITLVALVRLFIRVYFLMSLQIANLRRCKATLVTFVRLLIVLIFQRDSHHIWRSAHPGGKYWLTYKPTIKFMFMFDLAALFKLSLSFKNHAIYTSNSNFSVKLKKIKCAYIVCTQILVASPLISGAAGDVYVSSSMQIKIGF